MHARSSHSDELWTRLGLSSVAGALKRRVRLGLLLLCKAALLLTMVQAPEAVETDPVEGAKKIAEECVLAESCSATRSSKHAVQRKVLALPLVGSPAHHFHSSRPCACCHGHLLANGLRAPLRC